MRITIDPLAESRGSGVQFLPFGEQATDVSISRSGRLVYARQFSDSNIWRLQLPAARAVTPVPLIASTFDDNVPSYAPDGNRIAFASKRSGADEVWVANADGSNPLQLTSMGGPITANPQWSPDGRTILLDSRREGHSDLYLLDPNASSLRRLTNDPANEVEARWSRDGTSIYLSSDKTGRYEVWRMPAAGGPLLQITKNGGRAACESPDGKWVYYAKGDYLSTEIWKVRPGGGEETKVVDGLSYSSNFAVVEKGIYFVAIHGTPDKTSIDFFDFVTGKVQSIVALGKPWGYGMAISPDERSILFSMVDHAGSNLMLVENFR
jgi:Tol biopolymer transport system component